jgi:DNA-binding transcriptional LysR family regulator
MLRKIDWESQIGRRLKLRDLHVFSIVVEHGSMAKAARHLGVSHPAVSEVIADLECALGVRLLDRSARGIEPTIYGGAVLKRSAAVFDELKQTIRDIEFLSDASTGEVRIGCMEAPWFTLLPNVIRRFSKQYPRIEVHTDLIDHSEVFRGLRERRYDCMLVLVQVRPHDEAADDLTVEILYEDAMIVAASAHSKWARRRKVDLAELIDEPWIFCGALGPSAGRGNFPSPRPFQAQTDNNHGLHNPSRPSGRQRPVPRSVRDLRPAAVDCRPLRRQVATR